MNGSYQRVDIRKRAIVTQIAGDARQPRPIVAIDRVGDAEIPASSAQCTDHSLHNGLTPKRPHIVPVPIEKLVVGECRVRQTTRPGQPVAEDPEALTLRGMIARLDRRLQGTPRPAAHAASDEGLGQQAVSDGERGIVTRRLPGSQAGFTEAPSAEMLDPLNVGVQCFGLIRQEILR